MRFSLRLGRFYKEDAILQHEEVLDLLNDYADRNEQLVTKCNSLKSRLEDDFNSANCITVQKSKINDLEKENHQLKSDLDYYKAKCASLEEGLFKSDREINKLKMTEKQYCGQCNHLLRKGFKDGLPQLYCPIIEKEVSFIGFTCPDFKKRVVSDECDYELTEIERRVFR